MDIKYSIYIITCIITSKQYVGITKNLSKRWSQHKSCKKDYPLHHAIRKYGIENFVFTHIADAFNVECAYAIEIMLIAEHNTMAPNGYNLTSGGDGVRGKAWTKEEKLQKSQHMKEYMASLTTEERVKKFSSFTGKKHSEEVKKRIAEGNRKPRPQSSQPGEKNAMFGMNGDKNPFFGKKHSEETKAKMKAAWAIRKAKGWIDPRIGKQVSEEAKRKMSIAQSLRYAKKEMA